MAVWLVGMACNITVRLINSGKMPVTDYFSDLLPGQTATHLSAFEQPARLSLLWDRFEVGTKIVGMGDILMALDFLQSFASANNCGWKN